MASLLRQIVAGPRAQHPEAGIDLCYVTSQIIATSGPGASYPQLAYRTPIKDLVRYLDSKHGSNWAIWEFRAEGTGYPDEEVYGRVWHYPWPDHHPPPFALVPLIMGSMRKWLKGSDGEREGRVVVVHCKAGKGRSGTMACSYLISEEGWTPQDAMQRFTERRMRPGFGVGISIPSQQRWIRYVDRWARNGKIYLERPIEVVEVHVWGLRDGVKIVVEGYVDEGKTIKKFHTFQSGEREVVGGAVRAQTGFADVAREVIGRQRSLKEKKRATTSDNLDDEKLAHSKTEASSLNSDVIFRPSSRVVLPSSDINIDFERRNKTKYGGFTMVTSVAHVWFNAFFEGSGPEQSGNPNDSGVFEMEWDAMDGIKGSSRKGTRAFDRFAVVWRALQSEETPDVVITEPADGEVVHQTTAADWRGAAVKSQKDLGVREDDAESDAISRASSTRSQPHVGSDRNDSTDEMAGVKSDVTTNDARTTKGGLPGLVNGMQHISTSELPEGKPESEMVEPEENVVGSIKREKD